MRQGLPHPLAWDTIGDDMKNTFSRRRLQLRARLGYELGDDDVSTFRTPTPSIELAWARATTNMAWTFPARDAFNRPRWATSKVTNMWDASAAPTPFAAARRHEPRA